MAKLTEEDVRSIRARYVPRRVGSRELAREFGVSPPTILRAVHNKTWRHLSPAQIPVQLALPLFAEESPG